MNRLNISEINEERVKIDVTDTAAGIDMKVVGDIDMEDPSIILDPLFEKVHTGMQEKGLKEVIIDVVDLNFLNSSGIKALAKWVMKLSDLSDDKRYKIKIRHNKEITWQVTSLPTLTYLVMDAIEII